MRKIDKEMMKIFVVRGELKIKKMWCGVVCVCNITKITLRMAKI